LRVKSFPNSKFFPKFHFHLQQPIITSTSSRGFWCGRGAANFFQNESKDGGIYGAAHHELVTNTPKVDGVIFPECSTFFFIMKLAWMAFTTSLTMPSFGNTMN
jgi:hypothetical protein